MKRRLGSIFNAANAAVEQALSKTSLAELVGDVPGSVELERLSSDGSLVGVRIASAKTTVPHAGGQRSRR
jgi:hypothetical protein